MLCMCQDQCRSPAAVEDVRIGKVRDTETRYCWIKRGQRFSREREVIFVILLSHNKVTLQRERGPAVRAAPEGLSQAPQR